MTYLRYAARMYNTPLLVTSDKARVLESIVRAHEEGRLQPSIAPARELNGPRTERADGGYARTANGIAIIQTVGTLVQRAGDEQLDAMSGLGAYGSISGQMTAAADDPRVDGIFWEIDTDGGEVAGLLDAVGAVQYAASKKPVYAIANEKAFSAGMWLASAATKLFVAPTGMVGSIGVRMLHVDQSQRDAKQGLVYTEITAGDRKADFSSHAPLSDAAKTAAQGEIDRLYGMFVAAVADNRGIDEQKVRDTEAGLLNPQQAKELGLVDDVQSGDQTLASLTAEAQHVRVHGMRPSGRASKSAPLAHSVKERTMTTEQQNAAMAAQIAEARAAGVAEGKAATEAEAAKKLAEAKSASDVAAKASQDRVLAILGHAEATGRTDLAKKLAASSMTAEEAIEMLTAAPKPGATNALADRMAGVPNPNIGAGGEGEDKPKATAPVASVVYEFRKKCVADARRSTR